MLEKVDPREVPARQIVCPKCEGYSFFTNQPCAHCDDQGRIYVKNDNPRPILGPWNLETDQNKFGAWILTGPWHAVVARSDAKTAVMSPADSLATGRLLHRATMLHDAMQEIIRRGLLTYEHGVLYDNIIDALDYIQQGNQAEEGAGMVMAAA